MARPGTLMNCGNQAPAGKYQCGKHGCDATKQIDAPEKLGRCHKCLNTRWKYLGK